MAFGGVDGVDGRVGQRAPAGPRHKGEAETGREEKKEKPVWDGLGWAR